VTVVEDAVEQVVITVWQTTVNMVEWTGYASCDACIHCLSLRLAKPHYADEPYISLRDDDCLVDRQTGCLGHSSRMHTELSKCIVSGHMI